MVDSSREAFSAGKFRSEVKCAIPRLRAEDVEWIVSFFVSELQASRSAAIEECAAKIERFGNGQLCSVMAAALRALKGEG